MQRREKREEDQELIKAIKIEWKQLEQSVKIQFKSSRDCLIIKLFVKRFAQSSAVLH